MCLCNLMDSRRRDGINQVLLNILGTSTMLGKNMHVWYTQRLATKIKITTFSNIFQEKAQET